MDTITPAHTAAERQAAPDRTDKARIKEIIAHCNAYKGSDTKRSILQLIVSFACFALAYAAVLAAYETHHYILCALAMIPAAGLVVKLFIIQHDCGHGSFFKSRLANDTVGRIISLLSFTPYDMWRRAHNFHHAGSGNLNRRGSGSVDTLTVREYQALPEKEQRAYRIYRHPLTLLVFGPPVYVLLMQRLPPVNYPFIESYNALTPAQTWRSVMGLNIALVVFYGLVGMTLGWAAVWLYIATLVTAFWAGQWLFYIQHQFEDAYWQPQEGWSYAEAALFGSSYYALPRILQWFTGNIGFHHIHHLCASIPNYRLQECHDAHEDLQKINRITLRESWKSAWLALWDEDKGRMIRFKDLPRKSHA
ncbi:MAG: fatty acid desaturase [Alphaproteobacteria bacterium]|nr:fatty acid desaturase [Alphaproteobacteria bacterium]